MDWIFIDSLVGLGFASDFDPFRDRLGPPFEAWKFEISVCFTVLFCHLDVFSFKALLEASWGLLGGGGSLGGPLWLKSRHKIGQEAIRSLLDYFWAGSGPYQASLFALGSPK